MVFNYRIYCFKTHLYCASLTRNAINTSLREDRVLHYLPFKNSSEKMTQYADNKYRAPKLCLLFRIILLVLTLTFILWHCSASAPVKSFLLLMLLLLLLRNIICQWRSRSSSAKITTTDCRFYGIIDFSWSKNPPIIFIWSSVSHPAQLTTTIIQWRCVNLCTTPYPPTSSSLVREITQDGKILWVGKLKLLVGGFRGGKKVCWRRDFIHAPPSWRVILLLSTRYGPSKTQQHRLLPSIYIYDP